MGFLHFIPKLRGEFSRPLNTPFFIAKRLIRTKSTDKELSRPIVRIATAGIALGVMVMILTVSIVTGFQKEIRDKVIGFGAHIQINAFGNSKRFEKPKLEIQQDFYPNIDTVSGVSHIQIYAIKEGVIETSEQIQGILAKGVSTDYDWTFMNRHLKEGRLLSLTDSAAKSEILISTFLAGRLQIQLGDKVPIYFQNEQGGMSQRNFSAVGFFETGLSELDEEIVLIDIAHIRKLNQWGVEAQINVLGCSDDRILLEAKAFGSDPQMRLQWSVDSLSGEGPYAFCLSENQSLYVVAEGSSTLPDTAFLDIETRGLPACGCDSTLVATVRTTGGSGKYYTEGFEIQLQSYDDLNRMDDFIYDHLNYNLQTTTIRQRLPEIFNWLEMLDLNTFIIVGLMILISIINMTSALLILIMERTRMIGTLKALGANSWFVQRIFLTQAAYIILIGLLVGNVLGISIGLLQQHFGFFKLDPKNYYVSEVPILLKTSVILILNLATLVICLAALLLPTLAVTQIRPSKAIRFD